MGYGPGTTVCWFLTVLSCFVRWTLHPKKRNSGSVDSDFIAVITFSAVAAGHLIVQVHSYPGPKDQIMKTKDLLLLRRIAAIEASLNITETFMAISVVLFLVAISFKCVRRGCLVAGVGLFCFSAEVYLLISCPGFDHATRNLSRPFLVNYAYFTIAVLVLLVICITGVIGLILLFYLGRHRLANRTRTDDEDHNFQKMIDQDFLDSPNAIYATWISIVLLSVAFTFSMFGLSVDVLSHLPSGLWRRLSTITVRTIRDLVPRSNTSVKDLDQAVAMVAGTTVLAFSIYSAADAHYRNWLERDEAQRRKIALEIVRLRRLVAEERTRGEQMESLGQ